MGQKIDEDLFRSKGFEEGADGVWRKKDRSRSHPPSGADTKQREGKPKRRKRTPRPPAAAIRTIAIVTVRTVRPRDYDGLGAASKHYLDGLRSCGLFPDDSPDHFECLAVAERVAHFHEEETTIELFQIANVTDHGRDQPPTTTETPTKIDG